MRGLEIDVNPFSTDPTKTLHTLGEKKAVLGRNSQLVVRVMIIWHEL
jgi:hypothetical protein